MAGLRSSFGFCKTKAAFVVALAISLGSSSTSASYTPEVTVPRKGAQSVCSLAEAADRAARAHIDAAGDLSPPTTTTPPFVSSDNGFGGFLSAAVQPLRRLARGIIQEMVVFGSSVFTKCGCAAVVAGRAPPASRTCLAECELSKRKQLGNEQMRKERFMSTATKPASVLPNGPIPHELIYDEL
eukprot:TRINITY_DN54023_c0_g1_i1.p1 TRINITY_DN54023_c0_g1~~TRINITY_DN54023_c0_g1_i1.p1  ORF type:complete len:203 (-),score=34.81 TRINITY_DN54023_c0_g1_i1:116-667(-)